MKSFKFVIFGHGQPNTGGATGGATNGGAGGGMGATSWIGGLVQPAACIAAGIDSSASGRPF